MEQYLPQVREYLEKFFSAKFKEYFEAMRELRPDHGYGFYYNSAEITQCLRNIVLIIREDFSDLRIPEVFPSPRNLIQTLKNFADILKKQDLEIREVLEHYRKLDKEPPIPPTEILRINNDVLEAVKHVLGMDEAQQYLNVSSEPKFTSELPYERVYKILERFHIVAQQLTHRRADRGVPRSTVSINDEYDVQDLLHALLKLEFDDIRPEEYAPSYAGACSRIDFILKSEKIAVEAKMVRNGLSDKQIGEQLILDYAKYKKHPDCKRLICFVYDPECRITNPVGMKNDIEMQSTLDLVVNLIIKQS